MHGCRGAKEIYDCVIFYDAFFCTRVIRRCRAHVQYRVGADRKISKMERSASKARRSDFSFSKKKKNSALTDDIDRCRCPGIRRRQEELLREAPQSRFERSRPIGPNAREMNGARGRGKCGAFVAKEIISKDAPMNVANTREKKRNTSFRKFAVPERSRGIINHSGNFIKRSVLMLASKKKITPSNEEVAA